MNDLELKLLEIEYNKFGGHRSIFLISHFIRLNNLENLTVFEAAKIFVDDHDMNIANIYYRNMQTKEQVILLLWENIFIKSEDCKEYLDKHPEIIHKTLKEVRELLSTYYTHE